MSAPEMFGPYRVLGKLGEGGMGVVYLAEHTLLGRKAAIKVLLPALSSQEEIVQRFFNEARAVTQISDPGIVQVFDFGYAEDDSAYIIMELLEGESMDKRLARVERLDIIEALRLSRMVCTALAHAHAKGIIHRDLKPENIFIVGDPAVTGGERAKILDFGIAKLVGEDPGKFKTRTGMLMGTPVYMSPEQCRGAGDIDHRSDIYAMGCVLFTMLTGRPPFEGDGFGELVVAHMREEPPAVSSLVPDVPAVVDRIVARCLEKSAGDRYENMTELAAALEKAERIALGTLTTTNPPALRTLPPGATLPPTPTTLSSANGQAVPAPRSRGLFAILFAGVAATAAGVLLFARGAEHEADAPAASMAVRPASPPALLDAGVADTELDAAPFDARVAPEHAGSDAPDETAGDASADGGATTPVGPSVPPPKRVRPGRRVPPRPEEPVLPNKMNRGD